jgi:hypothetical protein
MRATGPKWWNFDVKVDWRIDFKLYVVFLLNSILLEWEFATPQIYVKYI